MSLSSLPPGWPGYLVGLLGLLFPFVASMRKGRVDESALVLGKWKELVQAHESQIKRLNEDFDAHRTLARAEIDGLRNRLRTAEDRILQLERTVVEKDKRIAELEGAQQGLGIARQHAQAVVSADRMDQHDKAKREAKKKP